MRNLIVCLLLFSFLNACATKSSKIQPNYVSPLAYNSYDCEMLEMEYARLSRESNKVNKQQDDVASSDGGAVAVGMLLFWPALFFIDNDDMREQVAQLKGEVNAVEEAAILKKCAVASRIQDKLITEKQLEELDNAKATGSEVYVHQKKLHIRYVS